MAVTWTEEQQKVIALRDRNILVSAAAGSGKTAVLVERIITMLTAKDNPVDVDRLLIVTFTEAAAAEMKERIRNAIEKQLEESPDNEHLKQQATLIHNAQITTIHSFCLSVIRDHFHAIGIDPGFRIGEEGELRLLRQDVIGEILEEKYQEGDQRFLDFTLAYGNGKNDKKLEELVLKVYEFSRSYPDAEGWIENCVKAYQIKDLKELEGSEYVRLAMANTEKYLREAVSLLEQGLAVCREADGPAAYETTLLSDWKVIEKLQSCDTFASMTGAVREVSWARLAANRDKTVSEEKTARVKAVRDEVKGIIKELENQYFYQDVEGTLEDIRVCRPAMEELAGLVRAFANRFEEKKRSQNMIDFSDMEQYALQILTEKTEDGFRPSAVAKEYQQQFLEIMIDEYQDSNLIQEAILTSISTVSSGRYNIFMVGDVKQSIYRFRLSRPELFMEKFNTYDTQDSRMQRIDLHKNFRSRREVLDSTNYIFQQIMTSELGGVAYDDQAALYVGADYKDGENPETEVMVIDTNLEDMGELKEAKGAKEAKSVGKSSLTDRELEARAIAGRIRELIREHQVIDKKTGEFRSVRYSDIVILTRSIKGFADVFTEVLNQEGIPAYAGTREGYFATQEIGVLLDYLRVLDNRRQDIPLAAVLASSFGNLTEEELAVIKSEYRELAFCQAVNAYRMDGRNPVIKRKLAQCLGQLDEFRKIVPYTPMHELMWKILEDTGYEDYVSAMPGGEQRRANLEMLVEKARVFESTSYKGLFHFVRYIEQLQKYDVDYGEASLEDEQSDTVRVMTIHKSKGLEFPVVFVAGMGKRFNMQDARSSVALNAKMGVGLDAIHLEHRTRSPSLIKKVLQKEESLEALGEELRVLYVAFTRAKEKLIVTGTISNLEKKIPSYEIAKSRGKETLSFGMLSKAVTYWDWILPALMEMDAKIPMALRILTAEDIVREEVEEETAGRMSKSVLEHWDTDAVYEPEIRAALKEQFDYRYPYAQSRQQKLKFTVSELKKRAYLQELLDEELQEAGELLYEEPEVIPLVPRFLKEEEELTGASRGTAYHRVMELLDFSELCNLKANPSEASHLEANYSETDCVETDHMEADHSENHVETDELGICYEERLEELIHTWVKDGKMEQTMADCIRIVDIQDFLNTSTAHRMQKAAERQRLWKEQPFVLGVDAREIYPGEQEGELILVQGIIDAYFEEEDGLVVLDYKTDQIYRTEELAEKYHAQLDYYAKALEQMTQKKVKEKIIYSFTIKEEIRLP